MIETNYEDICLITSPAKVILCGEHAVVYGKDAIAIGISLHCKAQLKKRNRIGKTIVTIKSQIDPSKLVISSQVLQTLQSNHSSKQKYTFQSFENEGAYIKDSQFYKSTHFKLSLLLKQQQIDWKNIQQNCPFEYLIDISSQIPIGRCLGSSAAFNTVLTTAFLVIFGGLQINQSLSPMAKEKINCISMQMQSVEHGNPSGIDNYVSVNGGVIMYNKNKQPRFTNLKQSLFSLKKFINMAIVDSGIDKNTKIAVGKVRWKYESSEVYKQKIEEIGSLTSQIQQIIQGTECSKQSITRLLVLTSKNHSLLRDLQVSHPKIEQIVSKWQKLGWSVKITGSGMGGCVLLLSHKQIGKDSELTPIEIDQQGIKIVVNNK